MPPEYEVYGSPEALTAIANGGRVPEQILSHMATPTPWATLMAGGGVGGMSQNPFREDPTYRPLNAGDLPPVAGIHGGPDVPRTATEIRMQADQHIGQGRAWFHYDAGTFAYAQRSTGHYEPFPLVTEAKQKPLSEAIRRAITECSTPYRTGIVLEPRERFARPEVDALPADRWEMQDGRYVRVVPGHTHRRQPEEELNEWRVYTREQLGGLRDMEVRRINDPADPLNETFWARPLRHEHGLDRMQREADRLREELRMRDVARMEDIARRAYDRDYQAQLMHQPPALGANWLRNVAGGDDADPTPNMGGVVPAPAPDRATDRPRTFGGAISEAARRMFNI